MEPTIFLRIGGSCASMRAGICSASEPRSDTLRSTSEFSVIMPHPKKVQNPEGLGFRVEGFKAGNVTRQMGLGVLCGCQVHARCAKCLAWDVSNNRNYTTSHNSNSAGSNNNSNHSISNIGKNTNSKSRD